MPEGLEAEIYRRAAVTCVGRTIERVEVDDLQIEAIAIRGTLPGATITAVGRHGKLVLVELDGAHDEHITLGLHFGMTGRLIVDGNAAIDRLEYSSHRDDPSWDRLCIAFDGGGAIRINDPRRWATFTLMPDDGRLGPDVLGLTRNELDQAVRGRTRAIKALLLDQTVIAGFGNLCIDEVLWHAAIAPGRRAGDLTVREVGRLWSVTVSELRAMLERGGSHTGTISPPLRAVGGTCPKSRCRGQLSRSTIGGRTTIWCPAHQR